MPTTEQPNTRSKVKSLLDRLPHKSCPPLPESGNSGLVVVSGNGINIGSISIATAPPKKDE